MNKQRRKEKKKVSSGWFFFLLIENVHQSIQKRGNKWKKPCLFSEILSVAEVSETDGSWHDKVTNALGWCAMGIPWGVLSQKIHYTVPACITSVLNSWFFVNCVCSALWGDSYQSSFHMSSRIFSSCKFPFLQPLISASPSCDIYGLFLRIYQSLCWKWLQAQMLKGWYNSSISSKKRPKSWFFCFGRTVAIIAVASHWAREMRQLGEGDCCNTKWELPGDEGIHWPATESRVVPLGLWNSWEFIVVQTE